MLLKTDLLPYDEVVDMLLLDPDGFIIRLVEQTKNRLDIYILLISFHGLG